jgi:hypothetical protein
MCADRRLAATPPLAPVSPRPGLFTPAVADVAGVYHQGNRTPAVGELDASLL